jgi:L-methionine (R)-S-oxide reductase
MRGEFGFTFCVKKTACRVRNGRCVGYQQPTANSQQLTTNNKMAESLIIDQTLSKEDKYKSLLPQIQALVAGEDDLIANLANVMAALKSAFGFFWVGAYLTQKEELVLGPFQGPVACTRIPFHRGVCGASYTRQQTILVPDVEAFPGHIACSSDARSEIVVPVIQNGVVHMVLDVDSDRLNDFDQTDQVYLEKLAQLMAGWF